MKALIPQSIKNIYHLINAIIANLYYGFPSKKLVVVGITGTDGKTTTATFLHSILRSADINVGLITTVNAMYAGKELETGFHVTSPDPWHVQKFLHDMKKHGVTHVILEVTSHAIDQSRFWGIRFQVAGLTNITPEHLDYHKTFERYVETKMKLLNRADVGITYEEIEKSDLFQDIQVNMLGDYNKKNARLAAVMAQKLDISNEHIYNGVKNVGGIIGRMDVVHDELFQIIIDFAHTPDGLDKALTYLREIVNERGGKLIHVFGSAGDRDQYKRPGMGEMSNKYADYSIVTSEDPRSEDVHTIIDQIIKGMHDVRIDENVFIVADRLEAISFAIRSLAREHDIVVITGKGHEQSMNIDGIEQHWSDYEAVAKSLED